jgi:predicted AlkP superfamily pyrophosphatase or phosphodiesterase
MYRRTFVLALLALITLNLAIGPSELRVWSMHRLPDQPKRVLLISLDGLDARYLREPDKYGLKIPTLRRLMSDGVTALRGVVSVYPSVTYPNHTTMVTGAQPLRHGIFANEVFNPSAPMSNAWAWFAREIRTDTLWDAAKREGLSSAMISWPVSTGAGDWNVPEIWKLGTSPSNFPATLAEMTAHQRPAGLMAEVLQHNPAVYSKVTRDEGDDMRTGFAEYIIENKKPQIVLVHLFDLDHFQHDYGPFTPEAVAALEKSDAYVARLLAALDRAGTRAETAVVITSDHGFRAYTTHIRPNVILARAGLIKSREEKNPDGTVRHVLTEWRAWAQSNGGSCAIFLNDANDRDALDRALLAFRNLVAVETGGSHPGGKSLLRILNQREVGKEGGNPKAAFMLETTEGYAFSGSLAGEPIVEGKRRGAHGYLPQPADYRASFIASGARVTRRGDLGEIRMIDIGPTVAQHIGLKLRDAEGRAYKLSR